MYIYTYLYTYIYIYLYFWCAIFCPYKGPRRLGRPAALERDPDPFAAAGLQGFQGEGFQLSTNHFDILRELSGLRQNNVICSIRGPLTVSFNQYPRNPPGLQGLRRRLPRRARGLPNSILYSTLLYYTMLYYTILYYSTFQQNSILGIPQAFQRIYESVEADKEALPI